jgi:type IV pilus assembly protein PilO
LIAVPMASWYFVFRPRNTAIAAAKVEIGHKRGMLAKLQEATAQAADLEQANKDIGESINAIEARLPTNKEIADILRQVSNLALESGLAAPIMEAKKPVKAAMYMEQPLDMTIEGDFRGFYNFLLELEKLQRITKIPDFMIKRSDRTDGYMEAKFTLSIYFQQDDGGIAP